MTDTPDTSTKAAERFADMLERDARRQDILPPEMTGLSEDDEREIAATLRALAADISAWQTVAESNQQMAQSWQARAEAAEAKLEAVARRALEVAGKEAEDRFTEYEGCGVYVYGSSVSDAIRAIDPAAALRAVMEGKE